MESNPSHTADLHAEAARVVFSPEIGAAVSLADAVREKTRLYPQATAQEIVAMFEVDGQMVPSSLVRDIKNEMLGNMV